MEDQFKAIVARLEEKGVLKQHIYRTTRVVFDRLKVLAAAMASALGEHFEKVDATVTISYQELGEFEFSLKCAGDLLLFQMQTNVQTFDEKHLLVNNSYVLEDARRGYFGTIVVYNFMADSVKYNRFDDAGYLLARMFLNGEGHFYIEGMRALFFQYPEIATNTVTEDMLRSFLHSTMLLAIETDLVAPAYQEIQIVALGDKLQDPMAGAAKVGFQMKTEAKPK